MSAVTTRTSVSSPCPECLAKIRAWEDTRPSTHVQTGIRIMNHGSYDDTPAGARANREARWQVWRDLVVSQIALINSICEKQHQPGQTELFPADEAAA